MPRVLRYPLQALGYALFMLLVWYFSAAPAYTRLQPDQAVITLAFAHAGARLEECHALSQKELARLAPNMRAPMDCPRERSPVRVKLLLDGKLFLEEVARAPGFYHDLGVDIYRSARVPVGTHVLDVQMDDNVRLDGPTYTQRETVTLKPAQLLVVDFDSETGSFVIQ